MTPSLTVDVCPFLLYTQLKLPVRLKRPITLKLPLKMGPKAAAIGGDYPSARVTHKANQKWGWRPPPPAATQSSPPANPLHQRGSHKQRAQTNSLRAKSANGLPPPKKKKDGGKIHFSPQILKSFQKIPPPRCSFPSRISTINVCWNWLLRLYFIQRPLLKHRSEQQFTVTNIFLFSWPGCANACLLTTKSTPSGLQKP